MRDANTAVENDPPPQAQPMSDTDRSNMTDKRSGKLRKALKIAALSLLGIFALYEISTFAWKQSGSNEWKVASNHDGIKVWTLKTQGSSLLKVKGEMRTKARLGSLVAILTETEVGDDSVGIGKNTVLDRKDTPSLFMTYIHYVWDLSLMTGLPIGRREFIVQLHHSQDTVTKEIELNVLAAPNKLHPKNNLERVSHLNNVWTLIPRDNGEVDIAIVMDVDLGGNLPHFFQNLMMPEMARSLLSIVRKQTTAERYVNAKVAYISEPGEATQLNTFEP